MICIRCLIWLFCACGVAQTRDLYITYTEDDARGRIVSPDPVPQIEIFRFQICPSDAYSSRLGFDGRGKVRVEILVRCLDCPTARFVYANTDGRNPKESISAGQMQNTLKLSELKKLTDAESLKTAMARFDNIYFLAMDDGTGLWRKKVTFEMLPGLRRWLRGECR